MKTFFSILVVSLVAAKLEAAAVDTEIFYGQCFLRPNTNVDDREGNLVSGMVQMRQIGHRGPTELRFRLSGFNTTDDVTLHGFHIHEFGDLSDGCAAMEGHYNPFDVLHGAPYYNPFCRHVGDLGNIEETEGSDTIEDTITDSLVSLHGRYSVIGRGMVVHANEDDLGLTGVDDSATTGNAGSRVACCVIGITDDSHWVAA